MTINHYWRALRWYLLAWILLILFGSIAVGIYLSRYSELNSELIQAQQRLRTEQIKVTQQAAYQRDVGFYLTHKALLQQLGLGSPANPSLWINDWHALQQQSKLPHMQYDIQPSTNCEGLVCNPFWPVTNVTGLSMTITPVNMRWSLEHEADVLDWLRSLQQQYAGMMLVRNCKWALVESDALISAQCELQWFNFPGLLPEVAT